ncbi:unnamed protein product [[Candida] boidinii]|uniref:Unnamed protein product n=1 Tax=Candida boidinii TaxID=5477 RepID=A0A9W6T580_CANBO|nr:unnamed protein product [[Candida] boidinii]
MSLVSNFRLTKISEPTTNATVNTDVDNVFESDLTTDTETDTETETENVHSHQKEILRKLEEEYVEIKSYRERLRANIDSYAKLLVQLDFGTLEDKNPSKFREGVYDRLEEHKNQMLVMFKDNHEDIKISLSDTILKQILNKRALQIEKDNSAAVYLKEYRHLAFDKVIINPKGYVRDYECKLSMPKDDLRGHNNCSACGYYIGSGSVCYNCHKKETKCTVDHTYSFNEKLLAVLYTQINSINKEGKNDIKVPIGHEYSPNAWRKKLFELFSNEKIQRYVSEAPEKTTKPE